MNKSIINFAADIEQPLKSKKEKKGQEIQFVNNQYVPNSLENARQAFTQLSNAGILTTGGCPLPLGEYEGKVKNPDADIRFIKYIDRQTGAERALTIFKVMVKHNGKTVCDIAAMNQNDFDTLASGESLKMTVVNRNGTKRLILA